MAGTIRIEGDDLILELHGVDQIFAIKRSISVPLAHITSVSTDTVPWKAFQQLKVGGTSLTGVIKEGRFLDQNGMTFFEMRHPDRCITLNLDHETYKKIVFEVDDKEAAAQTIRGVLPPHG
jgi:hypothetical protein